ncbi:TPA: restriction endonuclease subunit S [Proteus mirabilis]|nr:restriction endonuclease subunit S [Proteus mirabilis]HEK1921644.1 restriction endonuclease subunit S [Proteus mirabilis]
MSNLSYLEKLLDGVEVEWLSLGDISEKISSGGTPKTGVPEYYNGDIPWLRTQEVDFGDIWDTGVKITEAGVKDSSAKWIPANCVIIAMYGATVGKIGINKIPMTTNQACANIALNSKVADYKYVFHFLSSQYEYIKSLGSGSQTNINAGIVKKLLIPIPCPDNPEKSLAIQSEIVRILDKFTALTAELTAELNMRKKQYNYYRDQLLSFEEGEVEWSCLSELTSRTSNIRWQETDEAYQYIDLSSVSIENNSIVQTTVIDSLSAPSRAQKLIQENDVIFATTRPTQMRVCLISSDYDNSIASTGYCILRAVPQKALPKWIYYCLTSSSFKHYLEENQSGSAYPAISDTKLKEFSIPVPSLEEQARIVALLDKFELLTNSITEGLPREIELRQKQYEYYRDLLLNFPKSHSNEVA